jgi:hypothetical protein
VYETSMNRSTLQIPLQSVPIDRTPSGAAAFGNAAGVEAAGWWDDLVGGAHDVIGLGKSLGGFGI